MLKYSSINIFVQGIESDSYNRRGLVRPGHIVGVGINSQISSIHLNVNKFHAEVAVVEYERVHSDVLDLSCRTRPGNVSKIIKCYESQGAE